MSTEKQLKDKPKPKPKGTTTFTIGEIEFTVKNPDRGVYERVIPLITPILGSEPKFIQAGEIILNSCCIEGLEEIKKDDTMFISACIQAISLIQIMEAKIKKN